jgi:Archaeal/vacuolar-type H+-ATPase subunit I
MGIVGMRLVTVTGEERWFDRAVGVCIEADAFHMEDAYDIVGISRAYSGSGVNRFGGLVGQIDGLAGYVGIGEKSGAVIGGADYDIVREFALLAECDSDEDVVPRVTSALERCRGEFSALFEKRESINNEIRESERVIEQLNHLKDIELDLEEMFSFEFFRFRFGHMPKENHDALEHYANDLDDVFFFPSSVEKDEVWGLYITPVSKSVRIDSLFASLLFERVRISDKAHGTPDKARTSIRADIERLKVEVGEVNAQIDAFRSSLAPALEALREKIDARAVYFDLRSNVVFRKNTFCLTGWVPESDAKRMEGELETIPSVTCMVEKPIGEKQSPPTMLKNPKFLKPFEEFVNMYGLPAHGEFDPTPIVAITYFLFFGLMFGDLGQGVILIIMGLLLYFVKKMWLGGIIACVGVSSAVFGTLYGSVFGYEDIIHGFNPMENINTILIGAVLIGAVMMCVCMTLNIITGIRQKDIKKIFFSPNGLSGLLLYASAVVFILGAFGFIKSILPKNLFVTVLVVMLVLMFSAEPIVRLIKRRKDWLPEKKGEYAVENFFELFEVMLSYLTNTISYIRIGAFALSHVGMMTVVFLLAGGEDGNPVVIIIGNLFVTGFEGLIVGIQVLRLEFFEQFGRFYSGGGKVFVNCAGKGKKLK